MYSCSQPVNHPYNAGPESQPAENIVRVFAFPPTSHTPSLGSTSGFYTMRVTVVKLAPPCLAIQKVAETAIADVKENGNNADGHLAVAVVVDGFEDVERQTTLPSAGVDVVHMNASIVPDVHAIRGGDDLIPVVLDSDQALMPVHQKAFRLVSCDGKAGE